MKREKRETVLLQSDNLLGLIPSQIIYVEDQYDKSFNKFINENFRLIQNAFERKGYDFIYFPNIAPQLNNRYKFKELLDFVDYFFPSSLAKGIIEKNVFFRLMNRDQANFFPQFKIETATKTKQMFSNFDYKKEIRPGFFRIIDDSGKSDGFTFEYYPIELHSKLRSLFNKPKYWIEISKYIEKLAPIRVDIDFYVPPTVSEKKETSLREFPNIRTKVGDIIIERDETEKRKIEVPVKPDFSLKDEIFEQEKSFKRTRGTILGKKSRELFSEVEPEIISTAPEVFSRGYDIIDRIKNNIHEAKQLGIYEEVIREILKTLAIDSNVELNNELKISRLVIDSDYRIFLPDYGSMEIKMTTLPKSLFILFLWHPEGIILKQLSDYEPELMKIYQIISKRENLSDMTDSVKRICTPSDSSVNEKLSRIREAFVRNIFEKFAEYYYVTGGRGEKKQIKLDRELLSMPKELLTE